MAQIASDGTRPSRAWLRKLPREIVPRSISASRFLLAITVIRTPIPVSTHLLSIA